MRTITYHINHWLPEETGAGDCFEVIEVETRHTVTGDEQEHNCVAAFDTREAAQAFITTLTNGD